MTLPTAFLDELRRRLPLSEVVGRKVRLTRRGREHTGLCPFHNEKTPSFTVSDDKGFYHCFGCQAHGDVISFVQETEGLGFMEAVKSLAEEAGLEVPEQSPADREREARAKPLQDAVEQAAAWFEAQLQGAKGRSARDYLERRGLKEQTIRAFRLGFAPNERGLLRKALNAKGIGDDLLVAAGLLKKAEDGSLRDYFFDRVMFPITDRQGRAIAFGGRALGDSPAKYLNSPDSDLFHKGRVLFNHARAREAVAGRGGADRAVLLVVEGYMDVIALDEAGLRGAVAPLGTALTEQQMMELWRMSDRPVICLDGDEAGLRAAYRAAERALSVLRPGRSLNFAFLPKGEDPDSLVRAQGPAAMARLVEEARPLAEVLWQSARAQHPGEGPEELAAMRDSLRRTIKSIDNADVRAAYGAEIARRLEPLFSTRRGWSGGGRGRAHAPTRTGAPGAGLLRTPPTGLIRRREQALLLTVINHPWLLEEEAESLAGADFANRDLEALRTAILNAFAERGDLDSEALKCHLNAIGFGQLVENLNKSDVLVHAGFARPESAHEDVRAGWGDVLRQTLSHRTRSEMEEARRRFAEEMTEENLARLQAAEAKEGFSG